MTYFYACTIKRTRGTPTEADYESYLSTMLAKNPSISDRGRFYEYTRGCHVHMLLYSERKIGYSDLKLSDRQHGWNINLSPVRSLTAWNRYIRKDQKADSKGSVAGVVDHQRDAIGVSDGSIS